ncbi:MAG: glycoside hydrolase family 2 protein [Suilimivivens sp.]
MNFTDAVKSIIKPHEEDVLTPLPTEFGESLNPLNILPEYPRPQMVRNSYINLNGFWHYAITKEDKLPEGFDGEILVPFSPEASLSGVGRQLQPDEFLWYQRSLPIDSAALAKGRHLILHFGAVDYLCTLYVNGKEVLTHEGGYLPFEADITSFLLPSDNILLLKVQDFTEEKSQARGKQSLRRGGIFYTAQSGIWQSVWMEWVSPSYIKKLNVQADYDTRKVTVHALLHVDSLNRDVTVTQEHTVCADDFHPWSPESPYLYDLEISYKEDTVKSYFAFRSFTIEKTDGIPRFCLNHKPCFLMGVLDQGYWPDGLYTAPSDEALIYDITVMKELGFNMIRKHIKVESARWYYHCDRLGMIVCQDMVNGGSAYHMPVISYLPTLFPRLSSHLKDTHSAALSREDKDARTQWEKECLETIDVLSFFPSIAIWCLFNEGWGQFDTVRITNLVRTKAGGRLIDSASGWFDQKCGDFISVHNYFRPLSVPMKKWGERAFFLSEYGGYACHIEGHCSVERIFGYKRYDTPEQLQQAYRELIQKSLFPLQKQGLSGAVYTQLSDVEEEVNGILTYDRKVNKLKI